MESLLDGHLFACPSCGGPLRRSSEGWSCGSEHLEFSHTLGIPDFLLPHRREPVEQFLIQYCKVRSAEGWGSESIEYYRSLPYRDTRGLHSHRWKIRARTYDSFTEMLARSFPDWHRLTILDVGAGNGWLSYRMASLGHRVIAVDINLDSFDGLGVLARLNANDSAGVIPIRAEFDYLPFAPASFDVVIFNASLHYARKPYETLVKTLPLVRKDGWLAILDSPLYSRPESARLMVEEMRASYETLAGVDLENESMGWYLLRGELDRLRAVCNVDVVVPPYGIMWHVRRLFVRLWSGREPASFAIVRIFPRDTSCARR